MIISRYIVLTSIFLGSAFAFSQQWKSIGTDLTGGAGFGSTTHSWADIDGDGDPDLYAPNAIWFNDFAETGSFTNRNDLRPAGTGGTWSAAFGDYNNDGKPDLHLAKGTSGFNMLLENQFPNPFVDVAASVGYQDSEWCQPAYWADYNLDGNLDIYITHEIPNEPHELWANGFPGNFQPRFPQPGNPDTVGVADLNSHAYGLTWGDIDIDGDIDLVTSACGSGNGVPGENPHNKVYENRTVNTSGLPQDRFIDQTLAIGVVSPAEVSAGSEDYWATLFDYDGDEFPDLFIGDNSGNHRLWRNTGEVPGDFGFELVPPATHGITGGGAFGHTAVAGDYDNDGDLDLYLTRNGSYTNNGDGSFTPTDFVPPASGSFRDASWVDFDLDGDLDLINQSNFYENPGNDNHWIAIELIGDVPANTTASAHGAKIRVTAGDSVWHREHRFMVGTYSQHMLPTHFGLADNTMVDEIRITWPNGDVETFEDLVPDRYLTILQNADCSGTLSVSQTEFLFCQGEAIQLNGASNNGSPVKWRIASGPSMSVAQFNDTGILNPVFTPAAAGNYSLILEYVGCPNSSALVTLVDTDYNGDGSYSEADLAEAIPQWNTSSFEYDVDGSGTVNLLDYLNLCHLQ